MVGMMAMIIIIIVVVIVIVINIIIYINIFTDSVMVRLLYLCVYEVSYV